MDPYQYSTAETVHLTATGLLISTEPDGRDFRYRVVEDMIVFGRGTLCWRGICSSVCLSFDFQSLHAYSCCSFLSLPT